MTTDAEPLAVFDNRVQLRNMRLFWCASIPVYLAAGILWIATGYGVGWTCLFLGAMNAGALWWRRRPSRLTATANELIVDNAGSVVTVPWTDIARIEVRRPYIGFMPRAVLTDGRAVPLKAFLGQPVTGARGIERLWRARTLTARVEHTPRSSPPAPA